MIPGFSIFYQVKKMFYTYGYKNIVYEDIERFLSYYFMSIRNERACRR